MYSFIFHPCVTVPQFPLMHFPPLHYNAVISTPAFSTPCFFILLRVDISTPAFSVPPSDLISTISALELGRYRYLESVSVFFHVGSVFGIGISEILVENSKFLVPHLYLAPLLRVTPPEFHSRAPFWKTRLMGPPGDEKV